MTGAELVIGERVTLRDGFEILLRPISPTDKALLNDGGSD